MSDPETYGPDEAFEEPARGMGAGARMAVVAAVVIGLGAAGGIAWFAYQQGLKQAEGQAVPMIKAEDEPIKRRPEEPGGMEVPHQDKLVFNRLAPGQVEDPVERLLPPPEEPVAKPEPTAPAAPPQDGTAGNAAEAPAGTDGGMPGPSADAAPRDPVTVDPPAVPEAPARAAGAGDGAPPQQAAPTPPAAQTEVAAAPPEAKPAPAPQAKPTSAGPAWRIQLASVSSREGATTEWSRMQKRNEDLLGPLDLNLQVANLSKGTFYRIQAGPLADRSSAEDLCSKLKSRKQDCLIVAP